jgi:hypothetical protein
MAYRGKTPINTHATMRYRAKLEAMLARQVPDAVRASINEVALRGYALGLRKALARGDALTLDDLRGADDAVVLGVRSLTDSQVEAQIDPVAALRLAHAITVATRLALWDAVEQVKTKLGARFDGGLHAPPYWMAQDVSEGASAYALRQALELAGKPVLGDRDGRGAWWLFTKLMDRKSSLRTRFIHMASDAQIEACLNGLVVPERWTRPLHLGLYAGETRRALALWARAEPGDERVQTLNRMLRSGAIRNGKALRRVAMKLKIERRMREVLERR